MTTVYLQSTRESTTVCCLTVVDSWVELVLGCDFHAAFDLVPALGGLGLLAGGGLLLGLGGVSGCLGFGQDLLGHLLGHRLDAVRGAVLGAVAHAGLQLLTDERLVGQLGTILGVAALGQHEDLAALVDGDGGALVLGNVHLALLLDALLMNVLCCQDVFLSTSLGEDQCGLLLALGLVDLALGRLEGAEGTDDLTG